MSICLEYIFDFLTIVHIRMAPKRDVSGYEGEGKDKAKWDDKKTEIFLKVCVEEILAGNRPSTHFSKEGWKNLEKKFHDRTGHAYDRKQLKNKWDSLKKDFSSFAKLVEKETGLGWDNEKKTIQAPEEWWTEKGKVCFVVSYDIIVVSHIF